MWHNYIHICMYVYRTGDKFKWTQVNTMGNKSKKRKKYKYVHMYVSLYDCFYVNNTWKVMQYSGCGQTWYFTAFTSGCCTVIIVFVLVVVIAESNQCIYICVCVCIEVGHNSTKFTLAHSYIHTNTCAKITFTGDIFFIRRKKNTKKTAKHAHSMIQQQRQGGERAAICCEVTRMLVEVVAGVDAIFIVASCRQLQKRCACAAVCMHIFAHTCMYICRYLCTCICNANRFHVISLVYFCMLLLWHTHFSWFIFFLTVNYVACCYNKSCG